MTGAMMGQTSQGRTGHHIPLVDVVAHAKMLHADRRSDIITTATIYGAAVLATAGFVVAAVVDQLLGEPHRRRRRDVQHGTSR